MIDHPLNIIIASASEGLDVANAVRDALQSDTLFNPRVWNEGTFKPSKTYIEALETELAQCDFAVLTLTSDDQSYSRGRMSMAPRDNVLFELGLFMGRLGRERTYFVCDNNQDLKIPTDLLGVNPASYERREDQDLGEALAIACSAIARRMRELGVRPKRAPEVEIEYQLVTSFCDHITGTWWGYQLSEDENRLALLRISSDYGTNTVHVDGETFDMKGRLY